MDVDRFHSELKHSVALQQELNRYIYVLMIQLGRPLLARASMW